MLDRLASPWSLALLAAALGSGCLTFGNSAGGTGAGGGGGGGGGDNVGGDSAYAVEATQVLSSCGTGTLTLATDWSFTATLVVDRAANTVSFDNGHGAQQGTLDADGVTFSIETTLDVDMRTESDSASLPPCTIRRTDTLNGVIHDGSLVDPTSEPAGFTGTLQYRFESTLGSDCADLLEGDAPLVAQLPCSASYDLDATAG